jgi:hypothetical protein
MGEVLRNSASDPGGKGRADTGDGELRGRRSLQSNLLYGCLIEAAANLAKKHEPAVWQELLDYMSSSRGRIRVWVPLAYPRIHPDALNEEQRRDEQRRREANVKIWIAKRDGLIDNTPAAVVWPEAEKIVNRLQEILFLAYQRCEITIFIVKGMGTKPLSSKVLHTEDVSWCELAFPFDFAENTVKCDGQPYKVADVVIEVDAATPDPERKEATASAPPAILSRTSPKKSATYPKIDQAITATYDKAKAAGEKSPNLIEIIAPVQAILRAEGYEASGRQIQKLAAADQHKIRRRKIGPTVANEKRRLQRLGE